MNDFVEKLNQVLSEWDPVGVGENLATEEYRGYIPTILKSVDNKIQLMDCIENILVNEMGLDYNPSNKSHVESLQHVCEKIMQVCKT